MILIMLLIFITIYIFLIADLSSLQQYEIPLLKRFAQNNLGDSRSKLWWIGLQNLNTNFFGGKTYSLTLPLKDSYIALQHANKDINNNLAFLNQGYYQLIYSSFFNNKTFGNVHNLWLDVHYVAGIIPFCFLIFFQIMHVKSFFILILHKKRRIIGITVLCIGVTIFFQFMIEPFLESTIRFFMASCFLMAYFRQISKSTSTTKDYFNN
jgi:hypothetical protein